MKPGKWGTVENMVQGLLCIASGGGMKPPKTIDEEREEEFEEEKFDKLKMDLKDWMRPVQSRDETRTRDEPKTSRSSVGPWAQNSRAATPEAGSQRQSKPAIKDIKRVPEKLERVPQKQGSKPAQSQGPQVYERRKSKGGGRTATALLPVRGAPDILRRQLLTPQNRYQIHGRRPGSRLQKVPRRPVTVMNDGRALPLSRESPLLRAGTPAASKDTKTAQQSDLKAMRCLLQSHGAVQRTQCTGPTPKYRGMRSPVFQQFQPPFTRERSWDTFFQASNRVLGQREQHLWQSLFHQSDQLAQNADTLHELQQAVANQGHIEDRPDSRNFDIFSQDGDMDGDLTQGLSAPPIPSRAYGLRDVKSQSFASTVEVEF